jgi:hypothetical protein
VPAASRRADWPPAGREFVFDPELAWTEGAAALRGGANAQLAVEFVRFLTASVVALPLPAVDSVQLGADALLAQLLGATLVDAQDELWGAWSALEAAGQPERAERWMVEAPPWPPASVQRILDYDANAMALLETLAAGLAPDPSVRSWLIRSWVSPARVFDGRLVNELAEAVDGRLVREPRFRAWLAGEWTAWARQRYRRVARLAGAAVP